ncbi:hypothetical protein BDA96_07G135200 [Sorghum bicolor]|uniref:Uncharacterized protein n=2 Tax=Sorghum bicolor TaxID=4558 RepID=A0A921U9N5_SORBI|nr:hypothetical protein BDA96_07G135200 [Sorghum bicolor]OQU80424.1 hypothetical protein SORBI_3007G126150 [Sorghum bicolor]
MQYITQLIVLTRRRKIQFISSTVTSFQHNSVNKKKDDRQATVDYTFAETLLRYEKQGCFSTTTTKVFFPQKNN